jgi:glucan phosphoethanolaminetransferase (alkaline phosphatase superfamily)
MALLHKSHPGTAEQGPQPQAGPPMPAPGPSHARKSRDWKKTAILGGIALVLLVAAYFILGAFIPRWWSQRIGSAVHGSLTTGTILGLCIGFTFTLVPLFVLTFALRPRTSWKMRITWFVLALILAAPNLCTLGVVAGGGSGAHAGQRTMDVDAPAFRGASLAGVLIAAGVYLIIMFFILRRRPGKRGRNKAGQAHQTA